MVAYQELEVALTRAVNVAVKEAVTEDEKNALPARVGALLLQQQQQQQQPSAEASAADLQSEVQKLRALLAAHGLFAEEGGGSATGEDGTPLQYMADSSKPDAILEVKSADVPRDEKDVAIVFTSYKLKPKGTEGTWRAEHALQCQLARWNWVQTNPGRWINMLRRAGYSDADIDLCNSRAKPLDFFSLDDYEECKADLRAAAAAIEARCGISNARFIQQGSSCTGFSTNPFKGLRYMPTHIYHESSDTDFRFIGVGVADAVAAATARGVHVDVRPGAGVLKPSSAPHVFPELQTVSDKWSSRVRGKSSCLQFTVVLEPDSEGSKVKKWDLPAS